MRVVIFFALIAAGFLIPTGGMLLMAFLGPPPYVLVGEEPGPEWFEERGFPDGSRVLVRRYKTDNEAARAAGSIAESVPNATRTTVLDVTRYRRSDTGRHGLVLPVAEYVVQIAASTAEGVEARLQALDFVRENPEKNLLWIALSDHLPLVLSGVGGYFVLLGLFMARGGAWAARIRPDAAAVPVPLSTLRNRLLEINRMNLPFQVTEVRPGRFVADWRIADANWIGVMRAGGLNSAHRIHIDLDERARKARVIDRIQNIRWDAGGGRVVGGFSFFQGISFARIERGSMFGLLYDKRTGWSIREGYNYNFSLAEMKAPLVEAVTQSGWTWQPVVTFIRLIGG